MKKNTPPVIGYTKNKSELTAKDTYNIVSDTVGGINARKSDNLLQAKIVIITIIVCLIMGGIFYGKTGLVLGALAGLIIGFLGSGFYLMIFRAVKHASGEHD